VPARRPNGKAVGREQDLEKPQGAVTKANALGPVATYVLVLKAVKCP
jgi:hypothetical protein